MGLTIETSLSGFDMLTSPRIQGAVPWAGTVQFDDSYPTGGEALDASDLDARASEIAHIQISVLAGAVQPAFTSGKLKLLAAAAGTEVTGESDQSGVILSVFAYLTPA